MGGQLSSMQDARDNVIPNSAAFWNFSLIILTNLNKPFVLFNSWINSLMSFKCGLQSSTEDYEKEKRDD